MRSLLLRLFAAFILFICLSNSLSAQNCFNTGLNGTVINLPCNQNCVNVPVRIPHLKSSSDYNLISVPYNPFPYTTATGAEDPVIYVDDFYSNTINMPFQFCFYDSLFNKIVVGSNGLITFDWQTNGSGSCSNAYHINPPLPFGGTSSCNQFAQWYYPRSSIMANYSDLNPATSPPERKIQWEVIGTAPCRKFVISFYHVNIYGCANTPNTFQIVLYESTGLIDMYFEQKLSCTTSSDNGKGIMGIQDATPTKFVVHPARNATQWTASNEGWRFVPSGGASRFISCTVQTLAGALLGTGDTTTTVPGTLDVTFPSFCPPGPGGQYVIKTTFSACDNPANQIISYDTITINKTSALNATATTTQTACGLNGTGTATVVVPTGLGSAPFTYILTPGGLTHTGNDTTIFTNLTAGTYNVHVTDAGGCSSDVPVTITSTGLLTVNFTSVNASCPGAYNGSITATVPNATPPVQYSINGGLPTSAGTTYTFSGLSASSPPVGATYFLIIQDAGGCSYNGAYTLYAGTSTVAGTAAPTNTTCAGVNNGSIQVTATGTGPFQYSLNGGPYQASNIFSGLAPGTYSIIIQEGGACVSSPISATIAAGSGLLAGITSTNTTCTGANNGGITVTPTTGTAPYTAVLDGSITHTGSSPILFTGVSAGPHSVTLTDANGCITTTPLTITVTAGAGFTATPTPTPTGCAGANNGSILITPQAPGTGPFTFVLSPGAITQTGASNTTFTGLAAGTYSVLVRDVNGCQYNVSNITVTAGAGLVASPTTTPSTCAGVNNGTISVTSNGTPPLTFILDGAVTQTTATNTTTFNSVAAGPHSITVTDANGCITTSPVTTTVPAGTGFTATPTPTPTGCAGANNGSILITPQAPGTGPFAFVLSPGGIIQTGAANTTFASLAAGTYSVLVRDVNGCQYNASNIIVTAGAGLIASPTTTPTSCPGINNGTISVNSNGTAPLTFILDGTITQTSPTNTTLFTSVAAGPHSITVTDAIGCITTVPVTTSVPPGTGFTSSFAPTPTTCAGLNNGKIAITSVAPGTAPFTIVLNPGAITQTGSNLITFNNLAAGTYSAVVTDANGCKFTLSNIVVSAGAGLVASPTPSATTCSGANNGSIAVTSNGTAPFTFVLDGTITQTSATNTTSFINVSSGPHSITVTDANGCITSAPVTTTVPVGTGFTASVTPTPTGCVGVNNGSLFIVGQSPGTGPFTFVLSPGGITQTGAANTTFASLAAGTYSAIVRDVNGCQVNISSMIVPAGAGLSAASPSTVPTSCSGVNNGSISLTMSNGAAPFTFLLDGTITQTSATNIISFNNVPAGPHSITVTDANGCITSAPITTTVPMGTGFTASPSASPVLCAGGSTGSITVTPTTAGTSPFTFVLNGGSTQTAPGVTTFYNLPAGTANNVVITDAVGCTYTLNNIAITQPTPLIASAPVQPAKCKGATDGVITVNVSGGTPAYTYSLNNVTYQPGNIFNVGAGPYTIYVKDANGCSIPPINNVIISEPALLTAIPVTGNATCDGGSDGTITVSAAGGTSAYQYSLNGGAYQASNIFNVAPGSFDVTVQDANGCTFPVNTIIVGLTNNLTYTHMTNPPAICESKNVPLQLVTNATQFAWTNAGTLSNSTIANPVANPVDTTLYKVTATLGRCSIIDSVLVAVMKAPIPDAGLPSDTICYGHSYQLQGSGGATYLWTPATYLNSATIYNPQVVLPEKTTTYTLSVTDVNGCSSLITDQIIVSVTPPIKVSTYPFDTVVYAGAQIPLMATSVGTHYIWTSSTGTTGLNNPNIANPVATAPLIDGSVVIYEVTASTASDCRGKGYIRIQVYKGPDIYVVTGFSPNGDGKNETFIPFPVGIKKLNYFRVFNRWGQMLFSTTTLNKGWDGKFGGVEQASGVYVWMVEGVTNDNKVITKKGSVTLIH